MAQRTSPPRRRLSDMRRWTRVLPVIIFVYVICYVDRTNISFALPHLEVDMGLTGAQQGFVSGVFFWGYLLLQVPAGYIAERWSARTWVGILMVLWSAAAVSAGLTHDFTQLVIARFLLGVAEGGVQPALMATIRAWFPFAERSRAYAMFKLYTPIAAIIAAPFSGLLLSYGNWRWMFVIQGGAPLVIGLIAWLRYMRDTPEKAEYLSATERVHLAESRNGEPVQTRGTFKGAFRSAMVWRFALIYTLTQLGLLGLSMWLPSLLREAFHTDLAVGLVAMLPQLAAGAAIILVGRSSDRHGRHTTHICAVLGAGAVVLAGSGLIGAGQKWLILTAMIIGTAASIAWYGPFWATVTKLTPPAAAGAGIGLINGVGNLGGFFGPYIGGWLKDVSGGYAVTQVFFGGVFALAGLLVLTLRHPLDEATRATPRPPSAEGTSRALSDTA